MCRKPAERALLQAWVAEQVMANGKEQAPTAHTQAPAVAHSRIDSKRASYRCFALADVLQATEEVALKTEANQNGGPSGKAHTNTCRRPSFEMSVSLRANLMSAEIRFRKGWRTVATQVTDRPYNVVVQASNVPHRLT